MGEHSLQSIPFRLAWRGSEDALLILLVLLEPYGRVKTLMTMMEEFLDEQLTPNRVSGGPSESPLTSC